MDKPAPSLIFVRGINLKKMGHTERQYQHPGGLLSLMLSIISVALAYSTFKEVRISQTVRKYFHFFDFGKISHVRNITVAFRHGETQH